MRFFFLLDSKSREDAPLESWNKDLKKGGPLKYLTCALKCAVSQQTIWRLGGGGCGSQHGWCDSQFRKNDWSPKTSNRDLTQSPSEYFDNVWQHNEMHTFKCMCNVMQRWLAVISIQLSSAAVCHYPQLPADSPADSSGAPLRGIKRIVSTATRARPVCEIYIFK